MLDSSLTPTPRIFQWLFVETGYGIRSPIHSTRFDYLLVKYRSSVNKISTSDSLHHPDSENSVYCAFIDGGVGFWNLMSLEKFVMTLDFGGRLASTFLLITVIHNR